MASASVHPMTESDAAEQRIPVLAETERARWKRGEYTLPYVIDEKDKGTFLINITMSFAVTFVLSLPFFFAALPAVFLPSPGTEYSRGVVSDVIMVVVCDFGYGVFIAPMLFGGDRVVLSKSGNWAKSMTFFVPRWCILVTALHLFFMFATQRSSDYALHYVMFPFYCALVFFPFLEIGAHWVATEKGGLMKSFLGMRWTTNIKDISYIILAIMFTVASCFIPIVYMVTDTQVLTSLAEEDTTWSAIRVVLNLVARKLSTLLIGWGTFMHPNPMWKILSPALSYWILGMMNAKTGANCSDWTAIGFFILVDWIAFFSRVVQATHIPEDNKVSVLRPPLWFVRLGSAIVPEHDMAGWSKRNVESAHRLFCLMIKDMGTTSTFIAFILLYPIMKYFDDTNVMYEAVFPNGDTSLVYMLVMFANDALQDVAVHTYAHFYYPLPVSFKPLQSLWFVKSVTVQLAAVLWMPAIMLWLTWYFAAKDEVE